MYKHYRGENLPDDQFLRNTIVDTYKVPADKFDEFKAIFIESLDTAQLLSKHGESTRVVDFSSPISSAIAQDQKSERIKKLEKGANISPSDSCFVMQPFAAPIGTYYEKIYKPAIEKAGSFHYAQMPTCLVLERSWIRSLQALAPRKCWLQN